MNVQFNNDALNCVLAYPKLSLVEKADMIVLSGDLDLINENDEIEDTYRIEIHPSPLYPYRFPLLFETGGRIPINIDWHRFESDGRCCVRVPPEEILICKGGLNLTEFIRLEASPYFFNQTFRRKNGYFLNECRHGQLGIIDYYFEKLRIKDIYQLEAFLNFIITEREPSRVNLCFCGSKLKYRKCHRDAYRMLKEIGIERLTSDLSTIKNLISLIK